MKKLFFFLPLFALVAVLPACTPRSKAGAISLSGSSAAPGETIIINLGNEQVKDKKEVVVNFNEKKALVVAAEGNNIEVMVPETAPGDTKISVSLNNKTIGSSGFKIAAHPSRRLVFMMDHDGSVKQIAEKLNNEELAESGQTAGRKVAYELLDEKQSVLVSGLVAHPMAGMEVFEDPEKKIRREKAGHGGAFMINLPNISGAMKLRMYDVTLNGDSNDEKLLGTKKLITEINLSQPR